MICWGFGGNVGESGSTHLSCTLVLLSFILAVHSFNETLTCGSSEYMNLGDWFSQGLLFCKFSLKYGGVNLSMLILVLDVPFLVYLFSVGYMKGDSHISRFMAYLSLFRFFMMVLISAGNLVRLFIGWEGECLCSYLLINFWYTRIQANNAVVKAMLVNKVGDLSLLSEITVLWLNYGSWEYLTLFSCSSITHVNYSLKWEMLLFIGGSNRKVSAIRFTHLTCRRYWGTYPSVSFNPCCYDGNSWSSFNYLVITFIWKSLVCISFDSFY